jgi:hypothetical protein
LQGFAICDGVYDFAKIDTKEVIMNQQAGKVSPLSITNKSAVPRYAKKKVRIIKKVRTDEGEWKFISLDKIDNRYVWDKREGYYFLEWWDGKKRCRELAGRTPSEALDAQRRKKNEIIGALVAGGRELRIQEEGSADHRRLELSAVL